MPVIDLPQLIAAHWRRFLVASKLCLATPPPQPCNEHDHGSEWNEYAERGNRSGNEADEVPPRLAHSAGEDVVAFVVGQQRLRLVQLDGERADIRAIAQI